MDDLTMARQCAQTMLANDHSSRAMGIDIEIIEPGKNASAAALFTAQYRLQELKSKCDAIVAQYDSGPARVLYTMTMKVISMLSM